MDIKAITDRVLLPDKRDVLRIHLYFKLIQHKIQPVENDIDIIIELYLFGGYSNADEQLRFINLCLSKGFRKTQQSLRNAFSRYVNAGIFEKPRNRVLYVSEKFIPKITCDKLVLQYMISHAE